MPKINKIKAREILDSRGNPTLEVDTFAESPLGEVMGRFSVPSGASVGKHEALEKRDGDRARFGGKGVKELAESIEREIAPELLGKEFDQKSLDNFLIEKDGTENKSNLGANAIIGISVSFAKACAESASLPFWQHIKNISGNDGGPKVPTPMINIMNGGIHTDWQSTDIQEFMLVPLKDDPFRVKIEKSDEVFMRLKSILEQKGLSITVGDEGGFAPKLGSNTQTLDLMLEAIIKSGFKLAEDFAIALDCAASEFYGSSVDDGKYALRIENREMNEDELSDFYKNLFDNYPIISIEDPFDQGDWDAWTKFNDKFGKQLMVVGDDLLVTNPKRLEEGINKKAANSVLIKLNQIGTLSETLEVIKKAKEAGFQTIISHRSGETEDTAISHLAIGTGCPFIKTGSLSRGERTAKYNELLRIEESLKN